MGEYYIGWWNLENLFDVEDSPQRSDRLKKTLKKELEGWNEEVLEKKIQQLSKIIAKMNSNRGPDLLGVCEVENEPVVHRLVDSLASQNRNYKVAYHDTADQRGIDIAFIYDGDRFESEKQFFYVVLKRATTRDIFQVNMKCKSSGRSLIVVGNHWPSRTEGVYETEPYRIIAAETLAYWNQRIQEEKGEDVATIIMGDFNDEPHSRSVTQYALSTNCISRVEDCKSPRLYNLMWPLMGKGLGTIYYDNFPYMFDQFLISKGFVKTDSPLKVNLNSANIERFPEMVGTSDAPKRFGRPSGKVDREGFSDHFPISTVVREE